MGNINERDAKVYRKKYTVDYDGRPVTHKLFVIITDGEEGSPHAVQISASDFDMNRNKHLRSSIDWGLRFTTLALRKYPVEKVIQELNNTALGPDTLSAIIADTLKEHCQLV